MFDAPVFKDAVIRCWKQKASVGTHEHKARASPDPWFRKRNQGTASGQAVVRPYRATSFTAPISMAMILLWG